MAKDKTNPFAAGNIDLSNDYLSLKAGGVQDDMVALLPRSRIGPGGVVLTGVLTGVAVTGIFWSASELVKMALKRMNGHLDGQQKDGRPVRAAYIVKK
jgi:hypothetical protein